MRLLPRSLFGRLILLMAGGLVLAQLIGAAMHMAERQRMISTTINAEFAQRVAAVYRAVDNQPPAERSRLVQLLSSPRQQLSIESSTPTVPESHFADSEFLPRVRQALGMAISLQPVVIPRPGTFSFDLYLKLTSGDWLRIRGQAPQEIIALPLHHFMTLGVMLLMVFVLVWLTVRMTVRPLTDFAQAARALGDDLKSPPLPENGPLEVRAAAQAFNTMQQRIRTSIEERERFLAAVSHDLKTPVTRLRLRSEMLDDPDLRERFVRDLDEMQGMLGTALDFLHGKAVDETIQPLDLTALLESMVDDYAEIGEIVGLQAPESLRIEGRPQALRRAIGNLIDNGLKYGGKVSIEVVQDAERLQIAIDDDGPGLPEAELERVFEPFYRLESSRSRETGGVGLGLAIVRQIARGHGGNVTLENLVGGGLRAVLWLPLDR
ncbi:MAG: Two-component sensor histidine kinase [Rhodocyclaceae bacterium]|nr:MAG: Two-component sensor histidine kinase [Rhodocyclaceae bacterium]